MNTEMNVEVMNTPIVVAEATGKKRVVKKEKKTEPSKPIAKKDLVIKEDLIDETEEVVVENISVVPEVIAVAGVSPVVEDTIEEDNEIEELRKQQDNLAKQIKMKENAKKLKTNIGDMKKVLVENRTKKMEDLKNKMVEISNELRNKLMELKEQVDKEQEELDALCGLQDEELINTINGNIDLETELGLVSNVPTKNSSVKSSSSNEPKKTDGRRPAVVLKTMKPAERWELIKVGTMFRAKQKEFILYYKKTSAGVVECDKKGGLLVGAPVYAGNQEAANAFKVAAKIPYAISGWEFLQLYNPETDKAKSLKKWDGELEYLNW